MPNYNRNIENIEHDLTQALDALVPLTRTYNPKVYLYNKYQQSIYEYVSYHKNEDDKYVVTLNDPEINVIGNATFGHRDFNLGDKNIKTGFDVNNWCLKLKYQGYGAETKNKALPKELKNYIKEYQEYWEYMDDPNRAQIDKEELENIDAIDYDEDGRVLTRGDWQTALAVAEEPRSFGEHRAVFVDIRGGVLAINASAAIENFPIFEEYKQKTIKSDPRKRGDELYKACELHKQFSGHRVKYATKDEIRAYIMRKYDSPQNN